MLLFVVIWIIVFMVLVILHEFGHFIAWRKCWMKVTEFWIWLPPKICNLRKDKQWTQYTLNWIPLWWFCSFEWDDPTDDKTYKNPNTLFTAPLWKRLIVIFAWVTMNFLTAFVIFTFLFRHGIKPITISQSAEDRWSKSYLMASSTFLREQWFLTWEVKWVLIQEVNKWWLWEKIDLRPDDVIIKFDGNDVEYDSFLTMMVSWADSTHNFTLQRWEIEIETEQFTCEWTCKFDIMIAENLNIQISDIKFWLWWAILATFHEIWAEWDLTMDALWIIGKSLVSFNKSEMKDALNSLAWPIWAVRMGEIIYDMWWWLSYLWFAGMLSLALAIFNVLPIPVLDWWRAIWMILQKITRINPKKFFVWEAYVDMVFMYLLVLLGLIIAVKDIYVYYRDAIVDYWNIIFNYITGAI